MALGWVFLRSRRLINIWCLFLPCAVWNPAIPCLFQVLWRRASVTESLEEGEMAEGLYGQRSKWTSDDIPRGTCYCESKRNYPRGSLWSVSASSSGFEFRYWPLWMQSLEQFYQDVWTRRRELTVHEDTTSVPYRLVYERQRSPVSYLRIDLLYQQIEKQIGCKCCLFFFY